MVASIDHRVTPLPTVWIGAAVWLVVVMMVAAPAQERILLLAPLVIVPALVRSLPHRSITGGVPMDVLAGWPILFAALPLVVAAVLPRGPGAAVATLPWLAVAGILATGGIRDALRGMPGILRPDRGCDLATDAALAALLVGAATLTADRADIALLRFADTIRTLTAVHFHFAAFGLVGVAALAARARPGWLSWVAAGGLVLGTLVTAVGFMLPSTSLGWAGAVVVGASGLLEAVLIGRSLRSISGWAALVSWLAVAALSVGMVIAIAWATSLAVAPGLLDIDGMVRTHGMLNAFAVTALALTASTWARQRDSR